MIHRIKVSSKVLDARAGSRRRMLERMGYGTGIKDLWIVDVYTIEKDLSEDQIATISRMLASPVTHTAVSFSDETPKGIRLEKVQNIRAVSAGFTWAIETGTLPGVTDNIASTARELVEDLLKVPFNAKDGIYSSQLTYINGDFTQEDITSIVQSIINPLIQRAHVKDVSLYLRDGGMDMTVPRVRLDHHTAVRTVNLAVSDNELERLGREGITGPDGVRRGPLALDLPSLKVIRTHFLDAGRDPTDLELESIAQTWSEHCKHTIFSSAIDDVKAGLYKTYIKAATKEIRKNKKRRDICASVFTDNSGAIAFDDNHLVTHKVETHNSPTALDPFGGSITGIVGVNRDAIGFGMGAKPVINTYGFCFADPKKDTDLFRDAGLTDRMLPPRRILDGVVAGVNAGGNCSGIPTPQGFVWFDDRYRGKPLVFVGTVGLIPRKVNGKDMTSKGAYSGDYIVMVGGRVGLDGIHGATFSSEALHTGSPVTAVQIGDPITQKKLSDAIIKEARERGLYTSITDNGAGGLSCSVAEMAKESGGCFVYLDKVPLKYPGLDPWQIWISESQERMTLAVPKKHWPAFHQLMTRRGVEATVIGLFTDSGKCIVEHGGHRLMDLDMEFLHDGLPAKHLKSSLEMVSHPEPRIKNSDWSKSLLQMLSRLNLTSYSFISTQYDHEVQGGSVTKPLQGRGRVNADATVSRPLLSSRRGVVLSQGLYPAYGDIDMYHMAACSIDTAVRNIIAAGGSLDHIAILDNFCWCDSQNPARLGHLKRAAEACYDYALAYGTPFISGKDSMFNDFKGFDERGTRVTISIPPTLLISSICVMDDVEKAQTLDAKAPGDYVYVLGQTHNELGGSEYFAMHGGIGNDVPQVDARANKRMYRAIQRCIRNGLTASAVSVGRGGLLIALARVSMAGGMGMQVSLKDLPGTWSNIPAGLYSESQGRMVVTVDPEKALTFERMVGSVPHAMIGTVSKGESFTVADRKDRRIVDVSVSALLREYRKTFSGY